MMLGICRYHIYCYYYRSESCPRKDNIMGVTHSGIYRDEILAYTVLWDLLIY
jgi:hypothetical protein